MKVVAKKTDVEETTEELRNNLICQICGEKFPHRWAMASHVRKIEKMSCKDYYEKYFSNESSEVCKCCGGKNRFLGLGRGYQEFCSRKCASAGTVDKRKKIWLQKYGVDSPPQRQNYKRES